MRTLPGLLTLLALSCTGVAHAQAPTLTQAQSDEAHCIVLQVPQGEINEEIVLAYLGDQIGGMTDEAIDALVMADDMCTAEYMWDNEAQNLAKTLSLAYMSAEWLLAAAEEAEISASVIDNLQAVLNQLSEDEQTAVFLRKWQSDAALEAKIKRLLLANGAPNDEFKLSLLMQLIENSLVYSTQLQRFAVALFS